MNKSPLKGDCAMFSSMYTRKRMNPNDVGTHRNTHEHIGENIMAPRGRPRVIDPKMRDLLAGLVSLGCSRKQAARHVGVAHSTLFENLRQDPEFARQLREAELQQDIVPLKRVIE